MYDYHIILSYHLLYEMGFFSFNIMYSPWQYPHRRIRKQGATVLSQLHSFHWQMLLFQVGSEQSFSFQNCKLYVKIKLEYCNIIVFVLLRYASCSHNDFNVSKPNLWRHVSCLGPCWTFKYSSPASCRRWTNLSTSVDGQMAWLSASATLVGE